MEAPWCILLAPRSPCKDQEWRWRCMSNSVMALPHAPKVLGDYTAKAGKVVQIRRVGCRGMGLPVIESTANHHAATRFDTSRQSQLIMRAKRVIIVILSGPPSPALRTRLARSVRHRLHCESWGCLGAAVGDDLRRLCHSRGTETMLS